MGLFHFSTSCNNFCSRISLQGCLYSKQTWKTEIVPPPREKADLFPYQDIKHNVFLQGNGWAGLLAVH